MAKTPFLTRVHKDFELGNVELAHEGNDAIDFTAAGPMESSAGHRHEENHAKEEWQKECNAHAISKLTPDSNLHSAQARNKRCSRRPLVCKLILF